MAMIARPMSIGSLAASSPIRCSMAARNTSVLSATFPRPTGCTSRASS
ncbi:hypothetical protein CSPAE12_05059 [Colletotrichum incanum]|nr:hypothetical protein CSPAE12_05059 [Colletotrichum incanum]